MFKLCKKNGRNLGFSLVELSVIIGVVAIAAVGYMQWIKPAVKTNSYKTRITQQNLNVLRDKIIMHTIIHKRLPCPALPNINSDNKDDSGADNLFNFNKLLNDYGECLNTVGSGPVIALGLPTNYMFDEWGRRITYHVSPNLCNDADNITVGSITDAQRIYASCTKRDYMEGFEINSTSTTKNLGNISVYNSTTTNASNLLTAQAAFILVSHGINGNGAYLASGKRMPIISQADYKNFDAYNDDLNSDGLTYFKLPISSTYDDLVLFATKNQITQFSKKLNKRVLSVEECEENSAALSLVTNSIASDLNANIDAYKINDGTTIYNSGSELVISILWALQDVCSNPRYYGSTDSGVGWNGKRCPAGAVYKQERCICENTLWSGSC